MRLNHVAFLSIILPMSALAADLPLTLTPRAALAATVPASCTANAANYNLDFGVVTPGQAADAEVSANITCTQDVTLSVNVGAGTYQFAGPGTPNFSIYTNSARSLIWAGSRSFAAVAGTPTAVTFPARMLSTESLRMNNSQGNSYAANDIAVTVTY